MLKTLYLSFIIILSIFQPVFTQNYDSKYFRSPIDFPIKLAGNFGEIRPNHFHSGIDIKVPYSGKKIYASADGYISRIRIDAGGYGNALYITHPNGLMTVYAHLQNFNDNLEKYSSEIQYKNNRFEVTDYPVSTLFPVKKGDIIGYAGNSGRSYGPHLHFEIREADKDIPLNPLLFDLGIVDNIKPQIFDLTAYPLSPSSTVNGKNMILRFKILKGNNSFYIKDIINYTGKIGFSVQANDFMNSVSNNQGIYSMKMFLDDKIIYSHKLDKISFYDTRYINSFIDFEQRQISGLKFQKLFQEPGNKLDIYQDLSNCGMIEAGDEKIHQVKIIATDNFNNSCILVFKIKGLPIKEVQINDSDLFKYDEDNYFVKDDFRAYIRKGSLYKNINKSYEVYPKEFGYYSKIHQLNSYLVPLHNEMHIAIKPEGLTKELINKSLMVLINEKNIQEPLESSFINDFIVAKSSKFGKFAVVVDTIPPIVKIDVDNKTKNKSDQISFIITDNLSGISEYFAEIDGKPIIFKYDLKNDKITYVFDNHIIYNKLHILKISVFDKKNNKTIVQTEFFK